MTYLIEYLWLKVATCFDREGSPPDIMHMHVSKSRMKHISLAWCSDALVVALLLTLAASDVFAQQQSDASQQSGKESTRPVVELTVSPSAAPSPALKYRLLPRYIERVPGSAYPIYARLTGEKND
ncbi:MAG: hypothetical protein KDB23_29155, partial [Planctomycetales bacterium]|nr:hypothetical protein [Planctomycetales bacterium]